MTPSRASRPSRRRAPSVRLLLVALVVLAVVAGRVPSAQGAFIAAITNGNDTAATAEQFTATGGALPYKSSFSAGDLGWNEYGGTWTTTDTASGGVFSNTSLANDGWKATTGQTRWNDYTAQSDVRVDSGDEAGMAVRVTEPRVGENALHGYYAGLYANTSTLRFGRMDDSWEPLQSVQLQTMTTGVWWHLVVQAVGCTFTVTAVPVGSTATPTGFTVVDAGCTATAGAIGVRDHNATASWRNVTVTPGGTTSQDVAPSLAPFAGTASTDTTPTGWATYGSGTWTSDGTAETYGVTTTSTEDKAVDTSRTYGDATVSADVRVTAGGGANVGMIVRVADPAAGQDQFRGYYVGLTSTTILVGREDPGWHVLGTAALPSTTAVGDWWHLTVETVGCHITVTAEIGTGGKQGVVSVDDCTYSAGMVGVRTLGSPATWRQITVVPR